MVKTACRPIETESGLPPLAQRVPLAVRVAHAIRLDSQELVNLDAVELEVQSAGGHVHTPYLGAFKADLLDRVVPMLGEVLVPVMQGERIVLAQVLLCLLYTSDAADE